MVVVPVLVVVPMRMIMPVGVLMVMVVFVLMFMIVFVLRGFHMHSWLITFAAAQAAP